MIMMAVVAVTTNDVLTVSDRKFSIISVVVTVVVMVVVVDKISC